MVGCDGPGHMDFVPSLPRPEPCYPLTQSVTASIPLAGVTTTPVLSPVMTPPRSTPSHPTAVQDWGTAGSSPWTEVVTALLRATLCPSVDSPQLRITDCGLVTLPADICLVGVDTERPSLLSITLLAANRTAVREPVAGLAVFAFLNIV